MLRHHDACALEAIATKHGLDGATDATLVTFATVLADREPGTVGITFDSSQWTLSQDARAATPATEDQSLVVGRRMWFYTYDALFDIRIYTSEPAEVKLCAGCINSPTAAVLATANTADGVEHVFPTITREAPLHFLAGDAEKVWWWGCRFVSTRPISKMRALGICWNNDVRCDPDRPRWNPGSQIEAK
uniref:Uncharacterized protein n=1 Tax=Marseillevirus LCMAC103 TaxID=2506604 RepID=A0A481YUJ9_9VIRU|nr:MAG: hypothetical protein LCMAC103_03270 [Marseillevirus LCMAC103]